MSNNDPTKPRKRPWDYRKRMRLALGVAVALHAMLLLVPVGCPNAGNLLLPLPAAQDQPIVVTLNEPDTPRHLIDPGAPADAPPDPATDLIAEQASKAQDMTPTDVPGITPDAGIVGPSDEISRLEQVAPPQPTPAPVATPEVAAAPPAAEPEPKPDAPARPKPADSPPSAAQQAPMEEVKKPTPELPPQQEEAQEATIQLAKAENPQIPERPLAKTQSHVEGGVKSKGFLSFEAMESDFAPYLRVVRDRVERRWKAIMHVQYSGVATTQAVLDCAISPDGKLDKVTIVEAGSSATFAGLCKKAIEQAGPFGAFPFQVPEMYKNQNIEIRWTFSFL